MRQLRYFRCIDGGKKRKERVKGTSPHNLILISNRNDHKDDTAKPNPFINAEKFFKFRIEQLSFVIVACIEQCIKIGVDLDFNYSNTATPFNVTQLTQYIEEEIKSVDLKVPSYTTITEITHYIIFLTHKKISEDNLKRRLWGDDI